MGHKAPAPEHDQRFFGRTAAAIEIAGPEQSIERRPFPRLGREPLHAQAGGEDHAMFVLGTKQPS